MKATPNPVNAVVEARAVQLRKLSLGTVANLVKNNHLEKVQVVNHKLPSIPINQVRNVLDRGQALPLRAVSHRTLVANSPVQL